MAKWNPFVSSNKNLKQAIERFMLALLRFSENGHWTKTTKVGSDVAYCMINILNNNAIGLYNIAQKVFSK